MNKLIAVTSILAFIASSFVYINQDKSLVLNSDIPQEVVLAFDQWKLSQKRLYSTPQEQIHRLRVFYDNYKLVEEVNSKKLGYRFGLNAFSDLSDEEFAAKYLQKPILVDNPLSEPLVAENPHEIFSEKLGQTSEKNWCKGRGLPYGFCSAVRDQGSCASGYAFAAAKAIEYANNIVGRNQGTPLSPQQFVDCSENFGNKACNGGYPSFAINYAKVYGTTYDFQYKYVGYQGNCKGTGGILKPANYLQVDKDINSFTKILD